MLSKYISSKLQFDRSINTAVIQDSLCRFLCLKLQVWLHVCNDIQTLDLRLNDCFMGRGF